MIRLIDKFELVETKQQEPLHAFNPPPPLSGGIRGGDSQYTRPKKNDEIVTWDLVKKRENIFPIQISMLPPVFWHASEPHKSHLKMYKVNSQIF